MPGAPNPDLSEDAPDPALRDDVPADAQVLSGQLLPPPINMATIQLLDRAVKTLMITDAQIRELAMKRLIQASTLRKKREIEMAAAVKSTLEEEARIRKPYKLDIDTLKAIEAVTTAKIRAWDQEELPKSRLQQNKTNVRIDARNQENAEQAEAKGLPAPMMQAPAVVDVTPAQVKTEEGSGKRKVVKAWTVHGFNREDADQAKELAKLPASDPRLKEIDRAYLVLNIKLLDSLVELGTEPAGLVLYDDVEIKTRRGRNTA